MRNDENKELRDFNRAMDRLLKVPPQIVKAAMEQEKRERAQKLKAPPPPPLQTTVRLS
jgi:hypothetical protein